MGGIAWPTLASYVVASAPNKHAGAGLTFTTQVLFSEAVTIGDAVVRDQARVAFKESDPRLLDVRDGKNPHPRLQRVSPALQPESRALVPRLAGLSARRGSVRAFGEEH